jgi:hypothetical protein
MTLTFTSDQYRTIIDDTIQRERVRAYDEITVRLRADGALPEGTPDDTIDAFDDLLCTVLLPDGECDCGDYTAFDPAGQFRDRSHLTVTDCCDRYRFVCETGTVLDGAGTPDVTACKAGMGCDA